MENGTVEQGVAEAVDSQGSISEEHLADGEPVDGALDEGQLGSEAEQAQFDPNSPEARHWQSVSDRKLGRLEAEVGKLQAQLASGKVRGAQQQQDAGPSLDDILNVAAYQPPAMPAGELENMGFDDRAVAAIDARTDARMREWTKHVLGGITAHNQKLMAQSQQQVAADKIGAFAESLEPEQARKILPLYDEFAELAQRDPDRFIRIARTELGVAATNSAQPLSIPSKAGTRNANALAASATRPTRNSGTTPRAAKPDGSMRDLVGLAVDKVLTRNGG